MERIVIHSDLNNFYASVERKLHPELSGVPLAVGGNKEERKGIIGGVGGFKAPEGAIFYGEGDEVHVGSLTFRVMETPGHTAGGVTLICVTLNDPNDWLDHSNLYDYAFGLYESRSFEGVSLQIPGISSQELFQIESEDFCLPLTEEDYDRVKRVIIAPRFVYPPYDDGKQVGSVLYTLDGRTLAQKELVLRRGE